MKRLAKSIVSGIDHIVNFIALMLILLMMFLSCYMLWDSNQVFEAADAKNYEAYHSKNYKRSIQMFLAGFGSMIQMSIILCCRQRMMIRI